jgi:hypothetical protein
MAKTTRQTAIFGVEDWRRLYETFREADFQSYDFETLRKSFVDYLRLYYPEDFNDYVESSEFVALLDVMAFMGQALAFRNDLNTRENFLDTAERRDSVVKLANLVSYTPKRNRAAEGFLKVFSARTTEDLADFNGVNLSNVTVNWNDPTNPNWLEQFTQIMNAAMVDSQRFGRPGNSQSILGVKTDEYTLNLSPGFLPVFPYTAIVDGINMPFEAVSATSQGQNRIIEPAPQPNGEFNVLFRNDQLGFGSNNTGFFFLFKQGVLQNEEFNLAESVPNRTVNINIEGINNQDYWLYKLDESGNISEEWQFVESIFAARNQQAVDEQQRRLFSIVSRANDQITLTFGDGVFAKIPVGLFRTYVRASNGLRYVINPEEMQSVQVEIGYVGRTGRIETITFNCGITEPVSNAQARESIDEIKQRAPARYYTQNRMVNGEDYNNFPFTKFNNIIKSKAVARSAIGTTRYTDLTDITAKFSSTNIFAADGMLYRENILPTFQFSWVTRADIVDVINRRIEPSLTSRSVIQFYYANFARPRLDSLDISWKQNTTLVNETTGYFVDLSGNPVTIGSSASTNARFIEPGSLIKFVAPPASFFDANNRIVAGDPTGNKTEIWATVSALDGAGIEFESGVIDEGPGPVTLNDFVPTRARPVQVIPKFVDDLPPTLEQRMLQQVELSRNFGIGYNHLESEWYLITSADLDSSDQFSLANAQNKEGARLDASWLIRFETESGESYTVTSRGLDYVFASVLETRFFFDGNQRVYDSKTGKVIRDFVQVLKTNSQPDSNTSLPNNILTEIVDQPVESDGFVNDYKVLVSFADSDGDGVADNPDFFNDIVSPTVNPRSKIVFLQQVTDFDNVETFVPVAASTINTLFTDKNSIELVKSEFVEGQLFYATESEEFFRLRIDIVDGALVRTLVPETSFVAKTGRQNLQFQYRHNSSLSNVIDPGVTNIIDVFVVTQEYNIAYQNFARDTTGAVPEPPMPTIAQLTTDYAELQDFKMVSDNIVLNSVVFKPLFGSKAAPELRATIKVVRAAKSTVSDSEIKSQVVANINNYFTIDKWDFGSSFFFSELSAFLHQRLGSIINSVVLVPLNPLRSFGDLYEVRSAPNEIFVSAVTVDDIEVVDALTQSVIRSQTTVSGFSATSSTSIAGSTTTAAPQVSTTTASSPSPSPTPPSGGGFSGGGGY